MNFPPDIKLSDSPKQTGHSKAERSSEVAVGWPIWRTLGPAAITVAIACEVGGICWGAAKPAGIELTIIARIRVSWQISIKQKLSHLQFVVVSMPKFWPYFAELVLNMSAGDYPRKRWGKADHFPSWTLVAASQLKIVCRHHRCSFTAQRTLLTI